MLPIQITMIKSLYFMNKEIFPLNKFQELDTPFYYYDIDLLNRTLDVVSKEAFDRGFCVHYALKANANPRILKEISARGFGADCVSGNEILRALENGFEASKIVFAGVGKTDKEIQIGLDKNIFCFNVESLPEIEAINELAEKSNKTAQIAIRINPNVDAKTHKYITTGLEENKFGLNESDLPEAIRLIEDSKNLKLIGMHFHIGSQITDLDAFKDLCHKVEEIKGWFDSKDIHFDVINVGGGLGIDYENPDQNSIAYFDDYFKLFDEHLNLQNGNTLHFELGRSIVGQCGSLITRTTFVKEGTSKKFIILDAGMTELIRPALYNAYHKIENLSSTDETLEVYDVVGPICESSDVFGVDVELKKTKRKDIFVIRSAGAYGEVMASMYNCRELPNSYYSDSI